MLGATPGASPSVGSCDLRRSPKSVDRISCAKSKPMSPRKSGSGKGKTPSLSNRNGRSALDVKNTLIKVSPNSGSEVLDTSTESDREDFLFEDHSALEKRIGKTLYYAGRLPSSSRPSFPLTILAVNAFTSGTLGMELDTLEFLDLDMAAEIGRNACVSPTVVMMALVYLDRLSTNNPQFLTTVKPSELFVVALLVASKFVQDDGEQYGIFNSDWVTPVGFDMKRLNQLEIHFLSALDWDVRVGLVEFFKTLNKVELALSCQESGKRDWMTYTEINSISNSFLTWESFRPIYTYLIQVVTVACIIHITLVVTLVTAYTVTPKLYSASQNLLSTASESLVEHHKLETHHDPIQHFATTLAPSGYQFKMDSLQESRMAWGLTGTERLGTLNSNNTVCKYRGRLPSVLWDFQPIIMSSSKIVLNRHRRHSIAAAA